MWVERRLGYQIIHWARYVNNFSLPFFGCYGNSQVYSSQPSCWYSSELSGMLELPTECLLQIPSVPLTKCVTLNKWFKHVSLCLSFLVCKVGVMSTESKHVKHLIQCLHTFSKLGIITKPLTSSCLCSLGRLIKAFLSPYFRMKHGSWYWPIPDKEKIRC